MSPLPPSSEKRYAISGTVYCLISALTYTVANICMRQLTALGCDPMWAVFSREVVTTGAIGSWLLYKAVHGRPTLPSGRTLGRILFVGLLVEVVGNVCNQWALGVVGLAVTVPAVFAVSIAGGAFMARVWLAERVSRRSAAAIALLLASLVLLGMGVEAAKPTMAAVEAAPLMLILAVAAASLAGMTYSLLTIIVRHSVIRTTLPSAVAFLIPLMGVVSLGPLSVGRLGMESLLSTPLEQYVLMAVAGVFNLVGFLAIIRGLQRTTVVHANMLNASQVAMAAAAGIVLFREPPNLWLLLGIVLTIGGILSVDKPPEGREL